MAKANPNDMTVYDPEGNAFEVSPANAKDLVQINGWTFNKPVIKIVEVAPTPEPEPAPVAEPEDNLDHLLVGHPDEPETTPTAGEDAETAKEDAEMAEMMPFTTAEQFDVLPEREDVVAYMAEMFPDFTPHHLHKRDTLIAKAIELATGE